MQVRIFFLVERGKGTDAMQTTKIINALMLFYVVLIIVLLLYICAVMVMQTVSIDTTDCVHTYV
jgi:hypothetical protein